MKKILFFLLPLLLCSCHNAQRNNLSAAKVQENNIDTTEVKIRHARGFRVTDLGEGIRTVEICDPQGSSSGVYRYAFIPAGSRKHTIPEGYQPITVPISKVICMTSLQLSNFICLGAEQTVTGITSSRHLFNEKIKQQIASGHTARIGIEGNFDNETILAADPDLILISPFKRGGYQVLKDSGIPLVPHLGYKEMSPLGQAEWIKLIGILTGRESEADSIFNGIEARYLKLKKLTAGIDRRPTVLSGEMRGGNWYAVGGRSFLAQLFNDAGADYFLKDDPHSGGMNLNYETVYSRAAEADYWRIVNSHRGTYSYDVLRESDARYADFKAFKTESVIYCNMRERPFYEKMPVEPDVVLSDLIHIFHPELLKEHEPVYYSLLK